MQRSLERGSSYDVVQPHDGEHDVEWSILGNVMKDSNLSDLPDRDWW